MTPFGFLTLFPTHDIVILARAAHGDRRPGDHAEGAVRDSLSGPWHAQAIGDLRMPRIRLSVRMILALIAIVGVDLGWEIVTSRKWHLSELYFAKSHGFANLAARARENLQRNQNELARLEAGNLLWIEHILTPAGRAAEREYQRELIGQQLSYERAMVCVFTELEQKYQTAANDPFRPVAADPPMPERPRKPGEWLGPKDYRRLVSAYDDLIHRYPDLYQAHFDLAFILATCPDASVRNGEEAVASATRACELSSWQFPDALETLVAAYAEAGDFAQAIVYEQKAQDLYAAEGYVLHRSPRPERMASYKAGKPYHQLR